MATFTSAKALARSQAKRFARVERSLKIEHAEMAKQMQGFAVALTSGTISSQELARRGHPFGRGKGRKTTGKGALRMRMGTPLLPINRQSGRLVKGWRLMPRRTSGMQSFTLQNVAPHSKFVLSPTGTRRMVPRGFWVAMRKEFKAKNKDTLQRMRYMVLLEMRKAS